MDSGFVASFIGHEPSRALFVGLYRIGESRPLTLSGYWEVPAYAEMKTFGMRGFTHRNDFPVVAVLEDSALVARMPAWNEILLSWEHLRFLPVQWKAAIEQWRGIYYIFDLSDGRGYVGSAYGADNLLGRWLNYAATGHGGNRLLRERDPRQFRFTILQRLSPDLDAGDVIRLESTWKDRLHTRAPLGLNDN